MEVFIVKKSNIKLFLTIIYIVICIMSEYVYADEVDNQIETYINNRDLTIILDKMMGVTENMIKSEYMKNVPNHIDKHIINTCSENEKSYYNLLYQIYDEYRVIEAANEFFYASDMCSSLPSSNASFINSALRTQGIVGYGDYMDIRAREYNYLPRELKGKEISDYMSEEISESRLKNYIFSFLKSKVSYYYDETEFLKGNTKPIHQEKYTTYFDLLHKKYSFKKIDEAYNYVTSELKGGTVKRIKMIKELNKIIGYTDEKYDELKNQDRIILPYKGSSGDVWLDDDVKAVAFARLYYLSEYNYNEAWIMRPEADAGSKSFFETVPWVEKPSSRSYTVKAQEFIKGSELKDCLIKCLDYKNIQCNIDDIFKNINLEDLISEDDFNFVLEKFNQIYV